MDGWLTQTKAYGARLMYVMYECGHRIGNWIGAKTDWLQNVSMVWQKYSLQLQGPNPRFRGSPSHHTRSPTLK